MKDKQEFETIAAIAERAVAMFARHDVYCDKLSIIMDIKSVHTEMPLKLNELLEVDDGTFAHDIGGIRRHMDRSTFPGKLMDCFIPRMTV